MKIVSFLAAKGNFGPILKNKGRSTAITSLQSDGDPVSNCLNKAELLMNQQLRNQVIKTRIEMKITVNTRIGYI